MTVEDWLAWGRGPAFRFAILFLVLGMLRLFVVDGVGLWLALRRGGRRPIAWLEILSQTARWLLPVGRIPARQIPFAVVSMSFHVAIMVTPVFLGAHMMLWARGTGLSWPSLPFAVADFLTLVAIGAGVVLIAERIFRRVERALSRPQDFILPLVIVAVFGSGYLAAHPAINPISYDAAMLVHVLSGDLTLILLPLSKLSHALLFPLFQLAGGLGWRLVPGSGERVAVALGKENEPV